MTTIVYRDGVLATDSGSTSDGIHICTVRKIGRTAQGGLVALTGDSVECAMALKWFENGVGEAPNTDCGGLLIHADGSVHAIGRACCTVPIQGPFHARGSGYAISLGAMAAGATAERAISIACQFDCYSVGPVQIERL